MATLIFYIDDGREIAVPVDGRIKVGSVEGNDVLVEDAGVSARHAEITHTPSGGYHLRDLGSDAGTIVNGERVSSRDLQHGDEITFGRLSSRFFLHDSVGTPSTEGEAKKKLSELKDAYSETFAKHTTLLGVVASLANQERQKLASLDRLQTDTLNLETRIANARGILNHLEESITKTAETLNQTEARHQEAKGQVERQNQLAEQLSQSVAKLANDKLESEKVLRELVEKRKESETKRDQADAEAAHSRAEQQKALAEIDQIRAEHQKYLADNVALTKKHAAALASLHEQESKSASLTKSLEDITRRLSDETGKLDRLTVERQRLEQDVTALQSNETKVRETINQLENQQNSLATVLHEREQRISLAESTLAGLLEKHSQTQSKTESLRAEKLQSANEISRLGVELSKLQSSVVDMESRQSAGLELLRQRQDQVRSANEDLDNIKAAHQSLILAQAQEHGALLDRQQRELAALKADESLARDSIVQLEKQQAALSAALREREENITRADSVLSTLLQKQSQTESDINSLRSGKDAHNNEIARLAIELNDLRSSVAEIETQKSAGQELVRQRQDQVRSANEDLDNIKAAHQALILAQAQEHGALHERQQRELAALKADESLARDLIIQLEKQQAALSAALREREENITQADRVLSTLLQKQLQTESDINALRSSKDEHNSEIARLAIELNDLRSSVAELETQKTAGRELVRQQQDQVRVANESLVAIKAAHQAEILTQEQSLRAMLERLHAAKAQLKESTARNEILAQENLRLDGVRAQIQSSENIRAQMAADILQLEEHTRKLNSNLAQRHNELKSVTEQLTRMRGDESALSKNIQTLQENSRAEQQRFDQSLKTHAEINHQAEVKLQELESNIESLRGQINKLEAYLTSLEVWKDEMNGQYARLAALPEDSPEAFKLWREIHRKKDDIATQLPAQTGIKPRFNTQVKVVPRGQRPA